MKSPARFFLFFWFAFIYAATFFALHNDNNVVSLIVIIWGAREREREKKRR